MSFTTLRELPTWRRLALSSWSASDDPTIYGWIDIDVTSLNAYLAELRQKTGVRVTLTHAVGKAAAIAMARHPECNAVVSFGRLRRRSSVDVFFSVAVEGVDALDVVEIAERLHEGVDRIRRRGDSDLQRSQKSLARLPTPLLGAAMRAGAALMFDYDLNLEALGIPNDPFGSVIVTNVGVLGIEQGFAPLIPSGRTAALLTLGAVRDKVIAVDGQPCVRPVLTICGSFDHRVVDGAHLGRISATLRTVLEAPEEHLWGSPRARQ